MMFDDLREMSDGSSMFDEPVESPFSIEEEPYISGSGGNFLGMTPGQRFFISLLLLGTVIVLGMMCLMVTQKVMFF
jgi:hypothetical protein